MKLGRNVSSMSRELGVTHVELLAKSSVSHLRKDYREEKKRDRVRFIWGNSYIQGVGAQ